MDQKDTFFGFEKVSFEDKTKRVGNLFTHVSQNYDLMNDLMSLGLHRLWKRNFVAKLPVNKNTTILDLAGGTGDITREIFKQHPHKNINLIVGDLTFSMMLHGRDKLIDQGIIENIHWVNNNAEQLPFADQSIDGITISFGLRNVANRPHALKEIFRVLKVGGWFYCLEFSQPKSQMIGKAYEAYSYSFIPWLGSKIANDRYSYQYLVDSIRSFPSAQELQSELESAGFLNTSFDLWMDGVVAVHHGTKN